MAGTGPAPKPPGQRRRTNAPERGEWIDLKPIDKPILPALPKRGTRSNWHPRTKAAWAAWRKDPATAMYGPAEVAAAVELAWIFDAAVRGDEKQTEVRLRMDGLGLTAKGKRDLRWRTPREVASAEPERRAPATVTRLRVVDPDAVAGA